MRKLALATALLVSTAICAQAGDKVTGTNGDLQNLGQLTSAVPGEQGATIRQNTVIWRTVNASNPVFNGMSAAVEQHVIRGAVDQVKGWGSTQNATGDIHYYMYSGTGKVDGQVMNGTGEFEWTGGAGKLQGIKGTGIYSCKFGPDQPNTCDWSGTPEGIKAF